MDMRVRTSMRVRLPMSVPGSHGIGCRLTCGTCGCGLLLQLLTVVGTGISRLRMMLRPVVLPVVPGHLATAGHFVPESPRSICHPAAHATHRIHAARDRASHQAASMPFMIRIRRTGFVPGNYPMTGGSRPKSGGRDDDTFRSVVSDCRLPGRGDCLRTCARSCARSCLRIRSGMCLRYG